MEEVLPFLEHPQIPLDTNRVENSIRPFVIGSRIGCQFRPSPAPPRSARLYSLVETAVQWRRTARLSLGLFDELPNATAPATSKIFTLGRCLREALRRPIPRFRGEHHGTSSADGGLVRPSSQQLG